MTRKFKGGEICKFDGRQNLRIFGGAYSKAANLTASVRNLTELNLDFNDALGQIYKANASNLASRFVRFDAKFKSSYHLPLAPPPPKLPPPPLNPPPELPPPPLELLPLLESLDDEPPPLPTLTSLTK